MLRIVRSRLLAFVPTVLIASVVIFMLAQLVPGGAAEMVGGPEATPEQIQAIRERLGTDQPLPVQYVVWFASAVRGNFGSSYLNSGSVSEQVLQALPITLELAVWALLVAFISGIIIGSVAAAFAGRYADRGLMSVTGVALALPEFWVGILAIGLFAVQLNWVPSSGWVPWSSGALPHLQAIVLPALLLSIGPSAVIARMTRGALIDVLDSTYIRAAWAAGIPARTVYLKFALKNTSSSVLTVTGLIVASLFGGAVLIENVFTIPGIGSLLLTSSLGKDVPMVQAAVLFVVLAVLVVNLAVDVTHAALDPRTRKE